MMYQLRDDVLDVIATDGTLGKPAGQDLAEGIYTLPVIVALEEDGLGQELATMLGKPLNDEEREAARLVVERSAGIAATVDEAHRYLDQAREAARSLPSSALAEGFSQLGELLLSDLPARV
jgi:heptaprenyl diphosphate synthase